MHDKKTLLEGQKNAHDVTTGEWKSMIQDQSLSMKDKQIRVKQFAKKIEDKALLKENKLR